MDVQKLASTPPDPKDKPKPYDPPLVVTSPPMPPPPKVPGLDPGY